MPTACFLVAGRRIKYIVLRKRLLWPCTTLRKTNAKSRRSLVTCSAWFKVHWEMMRANMKRLQALRCHQRLQLRRHMLLTTVIIQGPLKLSSCLCIILLLGLELLCLLQLDGLCCNFNGANISLPPSVILWPVNKTDHMQQVLA